MVSVEGGQCAGDTQYIKYIGCDPDDIQVNVFIQGELFQELSQVDGLFEFKVPELPYQIRIICCPLMSN